VARILGAVIVHRENLRRAGELKSQLATAARIGAAALSGAMMMHRLMAPFALIQSLVDWLRLQLDASQEDREKRLAAIEECCSQTVEMIHNTVNPTTADKRRVGTRDIVAKAVQALRAGGDERGKYQSWVISHEELDRIQREGLLPED